MEQHRTKLKENSSKSVTFIKGKPSEGKRGELPRMNWGVENTGGLTKVTGVGATRFVVVVVEAVTFRALLASSEVSTGSKDR